jgi:hypothetical protein
MRIAYELPTENGKPISDAKILDIYRGVDVKSKLKICLAYQLTDSSFKCGVSTGHGECSHCLLNFKELQNTIKKSKINLIRSKENTDVSSN